MIIGIVADGSLTPKIFWRNEAQDGHSRDSGNRLDQSLARQCVIMLEFLKKGLGIPFLRKNGFPGRSPYS